MPTIETINRYVCPGKTEYGYLFVTIKFIQGRLSITGVEGPRSNGNAKGSSGQCTSALKELVGYCDGWNQELADQLHDVWNRWHLNDMRAGSPEQEKYLRDNPIIAKYPESHYEVACQQLALIGLHPDSDGYKYGSSWNTEIVPDDVLQWLVSLPESSIELPTVWQR